MAEQQPRTPFADGNPLASLEAVPELMPHRALGRVKEDSLPSASSSVGSQLDLSGATMPLGPGTTHGVARDDAPLTRAESAASEAPPIDLPNQDLDYVEHIAVDAGGSLIKLVYMSKGAGEDSGGGGPGGVSPGGGFSNEGDEEGAATTPSSSSSSGGIQGTGGRLHFVKFEATKLDACLEFMRSKGLHRSLNGKKMRVKATGGGAFRFAEAFKEKIGLVLEREDEMGCIVEGANFLLKTLHFEAFTFYDNKQTFVENTPDAEQLFPYLLVNIGSGVSIVKVEGEGKFERVSGTNLGGGTFWGLCRLLTRCTSFDEMLEMARHGDNSKVDMLVGDIYGGSDYVQAGLSASTIASSFGKVVMEGKDLEDYDPADIALALCRMVSYNIGQLAFLNAQRYGINRVYFGGFFIRGLPYTMETISFAIRYWSKGEHTALFLRHEGFLGAMGAFLKANPIPTPELRRGRSAKIKAKFTERFRMGAPFVGGKVQGDPIKDLSGKVDWVEKFVQAGSQAVGGRAAPGQGLYRAHSDTSEMSRGLEGAPEGGGGGGGASSPVRLQLDLHVGVLHYQPTLEPFPLICDPDKYNPNTIDITQQSGEERGYWLKVLEEQVPTYVQKAASSDGFTPEAHRRAEAFGTSLRGHFSKLREEPGAYGNLGLADLFEMREECLREFNFMDAYKLDKMRENKVALEVLPDLLAELDGMEREDRLLALVEGALAANIFDWGARECVELYNNGTILEIYRKARSDMSRRPWRVDTFDALQAKWVRGGTPGGPDGASPRPTYRRAIMFVDNAGADVVMGMMPLARELLREGTEVVLVANLLPAINDITSMELKVLVNEMADICPIIKAARKAATQALSRNNGKLPPPEGVVPNPRSRHPSGDGSLDVAGSPSRSAWLPDDAPYDGPEPEPRLYVISNGQGSPCLDLRRVPEELADAAAAGADLVIIEGMGRAIHTNLYTRFTCDSLKLAMVKNRRVAETLFNGNLYDCICLFENGQSLGSRRPSVA